MQTQHCNKLHIYIILILLDIQAGLNNSTRVLVMYTCLLMYTVTTRGHSVERIPPPAKKSPFPQINKVIIHSINKNVSMFWIQNPDPESESRH